MIALAARITGYVGRYWPEATVWLVANGFLAAMLCVNPHSIGLEAWASKAGELAVFSWPQSNFYPIGPALLVLPFHILGLNALWPLFFYFNVGLVFYVRICGGIENRAVSRMALCAILLNPYFFWLTKSSHDTVLQFAVFTAALNYVIERKLVVYSFIAVLGSLVRSTDIFVFSGLAVLMYVRERRSIWGLFPALYILVIAFNLVAYGSAAPSLNGGYNIFLGQNPLYAVAHPRYDIDEFFEREGHSDPRELFGTALTPRTEMQLDRDYRNLGLSFLHENPQRFLYTSAIKLENWFFNYEKVPNLSGEFYLSKDGRAIVIATVRNDLFVANAIYVAYKIFYNFLFAAAIFFLILTPRYALRSPYLVLLLPMFFVVPVILLAFPDTRFKIVYEVLAVPAILVFVAEARTRMLMNSSVGTREMAGK